MQRARDDSGGRALSHEGHIHAHARRVRPRGRVLVPAHLRARHPVRHRRARVLGVEENVPVDSCKPPVVLIFEVAPVAVPVDEHRQRLARGRARGGARGEVVGHVELGGEARILGVAHQQAVEPHVACGLHTTEVQDDAVACGALHPVGREGKVRLVAPRGAVLSGHARAHVPLVIGRGEVGVEGVDEVGVHRAPMPRHLPRQRYLDLPPRVPQAEAAVRRRRLGRRGEVGRVEERPLARGQAQHLG
mmetsp:Transcript_5813/g.16954  ORF Transcript_5813/g.16954 Transcript_5813/m.16954 type:complete len:247 (-) Transcript_5813:258-998(-)